MWPSIRNWWKITNKTKMTNTIGIITMENLCQIESYGQTIFADAGINEKRKTFLIPEPDIIGIKELELNVTQLNITNFTPLPTESPRDLDEERVLLDLDDTVPFPNQITWWDEVKQVWHYIVIFVVGNVFLIGAIFIIYKYCQIRENLRRVEALRSSAQRTGVASDDIPLRDIFFPSRLNREEPEVRESPFNRPAAVEQ